MKKIFCLVALMLFATTICLATENTHYFLQKDDEPVSDIPYGINTEKGKYVNVGDTNIYYEVYGNKKGEPFLIIHGSIVGSPFEMGKIIDNIQENDLAIVPATRGHGKSGIGTKQYTYEQSAKDLIKVANKVTKKPVTIIGFSDGAYTAFEIARLYPSRVKSIVAIGAGEIVPGVKKLPIFSIDAIQKVDKRFYDEKISQCPEPEKLQNFLVQYNEYINTRPISKKELSQIKCPVLLIVGEKDKVTPLWTVLNAYNAIPNASLGVIANAPHAVLKTSFPAVWTQIIPFIKKFKK